MIDREDPRLTAYALGEADAETFPVVEQALQYSEALRRDEADIREMAQLLSAALQSEAAPSLRPEQRRAVIASATPAPAAAAPIPTALRRIRRAAVWAGLCAAPAVVALWVRTSGTPPPDVRTGEVPTPVAAPRLLPPAPVPVTPSSAPSAAPLLPAHAASAAPPSETFVVPSAATVTVRGLVKDPSGLGVPGVTIVVRDLDTGATRATESDRKGTFQVAGVPAGRLSASADLPGFQSRRSADFNAAAGSTVIWNPTLEVGALAETVAVEAAKSASATQNIAASVGHTAGLGVSDRYLREVEAFNTEAYAHRQDSDFVEVALHPLSTLSVDVDTASYSNVRRFLNGGRLPPPDAVRIEELVNYFPYDYAAPAGREAFVAHVEVAPAPWKPEHRLLRIGLRSRDIAEEKRPRANLVFLIDVSGSMNQPNKLPLVQKALKMLVQRLDGRDRVALVAYAGQAGLVLPSTSAADQDALLEAIDRLRVGGSTNGGEGISLAYDIASREFIRGGVNRVVLATDGDFNVGVTDEGSLVRLLQGKARTGVFLTVLGFGMGNLQDSRLEALADKGNGNYAYVDTENEARKALVEQMTSTLVTVAKDVKIQVEFNPARVRAYRLIGYENRLLRPEDFRDDQKDAGEVGAGHAVTALYEIVPPGVALPRRMSDPLAYQQPGSLSRAARGGELMRVKLRYKEPEGSTSQVREWPVMDRPRSFEEASPDFKFAAAVAQFGMILRNSPHKGTANLSSVLALADAGRGEDASGYRAEFAALVKRAQELLAAE